MSLLSGQPVDFSSLSQNRSICSQIASLSPVSLLIVYLTYNKDKRGLVMSNPKIIAIYPRWFGMKVVIGDIMGSTLHEYLCVCVFCKLMPRVKKKKKE